MRDRDARGVAGGAGCAASTCPSAARPRPPTLAEVANVAAFVASDQASPMTATVMNLTCGWIAE
jgi:hypothetical protein